MIMLRHFVSFLMRRQLFKGATANDEKIRIGVQA